MITFSKLGEFGRLGNQLFQYALVKSVALETGFELGLPNLLNRSWHGQTCVLPQLNLSYKLLDVAPKQYYVEKNSSEYDPGVFAVQDGTDFHGYYQNMSYFHKHRNVFIKEFSAKDDVIELAQNKLSGYNNPTSIHIRRGDYVQYNQGHPNYESLVLDYIRTAISDLPKDTDFLVFTGGSRAGNHDRLSDFEWCKKNLVGNNIHFMEGNSEVLDFELIKNCKNNITGWDSTFSWWASYLNNQGGKIYCNTEYQILPLYKQTPGWVVL